MNGVCVIFKGWIDCTRLDGTGCLEFDEEKALVSLHATHLSTLLKLFS